MARLSNTVWHRHKFSISAVLLVLPVWFFYSSMNPKFPPALIQKSSGDFDIVPMPFDENPPYLHDGVYVKDFMLMFKRGDVSQIRQAYLNIGEAPMDLDTLVKYDVGILHGSRHGQHAHAIAPQTILADQQLWLTLEDWQGQISTISWSLNE